VIEAEKTPNRTFAEILFGTEPVAQGSNTIMAGILAGKIKGLIVVNGIADYEFSTELLRAAERLEFPAVMDIMRSPLSERAHVLLPAACWVEKDGTFLNSDRRVQRIRRAVQPPPSARAESELLQRALVELKIRERVLSAEGVFREVAAAVPEFAGLDYAKVGLKGSPLGEVEAPAEVRA
jgi:predicted molibdopterin-dependent oxidoreductase YjgC